MKNLPVADPKTLDRLGNDDNCCVNSGGFPDHDEYSLFSTDTWQQLKKNLPEFDSLAAMQAGFTYRPITVRRDGNQENARSVMGEFVSGNYFQDFGLRPQAGRLIAEADDAAGAPIVAVISYENWQQNYAGDPSVIGSTFWVNTKPVTIAGVAPKGFCGDRLTSTPPDSYLPVQSMTVLADVSYVNDPNTQCSTSSTGSDPALRSLRCKPKPARSSVRSSRPIPITPASAARALSPKHTSCSPPPAPASRACRNNTSRTSTCSCGARLRMRLIEHDRRNLADICINGRAK
jgi:hypothetical protein